MSIVLSDLPWFLEGLSGKKFGFTPGRNVKTLFLYFVSELRGNAVPFFCLFCVWFGVLCPFFAFLFLLGSLFGMHFRDRTVVLCGQWWSCVFRWFFAQVFAL